MCVHDSLGRAIQLNLPRWRKYFLCSCPIWSLLVTYGWGALKSGQCGGRKQSGSPEQEGQSIHPSKVPHPVRSSQQLHAEDRPISLLSLKMRRQELRGEWLEATPHAAVPGLGSKAVQHSALVASGKKEGHLTSTTGGWCWGLESHLGGATNRFPEQRLLWSPPPSELEAHCTSAVVNPVRVVSWHTARC